MGTSSWAPCNGTFAGGQDQHRQGQRHSRPKKKNRAYLPITKFGGVLCKAVSDVSDKDRQITGIDHGTKLTSSLVLIGRLQSLDDPGAFYRPTFRHTSVIQNRVIVITANRRIIPLNFLCRPGISNGSILRDMLFSFCTRSMCCLEVVLV